LSLVPKFGRPKEVNTWEIPVVISGNAEFADPTPIDTVILREAKSVPMGVTPRDNMLVWWWGRCLFPGFMNAVGNGRESDDHHDEHDQRDNLDEPYLSHSGTSSST